MSPSGAGSSTLESTGQYLCLGIPTAGPGAAHHLLQHGIGRAHQPFHDLRGQERQPHDPAHILVQCLTDPHWGMGYPQSTIGWSFWNAAWALSSEGFGLNLIWTRQQPIESFIGQVIDHIGGILYTDPERGTFELKLLRDDYWIDSLPVGARRNCAAGTLRTRPVGRAAQ